jgi:hypothetical protein
LAQQEPGFALFDQLHKDGPPTIAGKKSDEDDSSASADSPRSETPHTATASQREALGRYLDGLAKYKDLASTQRLTYARGLAGLVERFPDIAPEQGLVIARYLVGEKPDDEQRKLGDAIEILAKWKSVRLGLADLLAEPAVVKVPAPLAEQLFTKCLRRELSLASLGEAWPDWVREQLVRSVLTELSAAAAPADESAKGHDRAAEALLELYRTRARLVGLAASQHRVAASPSQALELLITQQAAQLGSGALKPADADFLARLPHEMSVVEYLGTGDLRRTVLGQRIHARLLAISLSRQRPDGGSAAKAVLDDLAVRDLAATHILSQLRDGEVATLRLWLLFAPKE